MLQRTILAGLLGVCTASHVGAQQPEPIRFHYNADRTNAVDAGNAIEAGIRAAIQLHGTEVHGRPIELVVTDHRGSSRRGRVATERFADDPHGLAFIGGKHSPPILAALDIINERGLPVLAPWAAAGPITRPAHGPGWTFRLSVDDTTAGEFIADAVIAHGHRRIGLMLEDTGWGRSNHKSMTAAIAGALGESPEVRWFRWGVSPESMRINLRELIEAGVDAIIYVGNTPEGATLLHEMQRLPDDERPALYSHWGLIGGDLMQFITPEAVGVSAPLFIQTRFKITKDPGTLGGRAFRAAQSLGFYEDVECPSLIRAPTGFVHAFDLTRLLLRAIEQTELSGDIARDRARLRDALERLETPVEGIIKVYEKPFAAYDTDGSDAHEALGVQDYVLARFGPGSSIVQLTDREAFEHNAPTAMATEP